MMLQLKSVAVQCLTPLVPLELLSVIIQTENYNLEAPSRCWRIISSSIEANSRNSFSAGLEVS